MRTHKQPQLTDSTHQCRAVLMGVVKHDVNRSAGSLGFMGSISFAPQAARRMDPSRRPIQFVCETLRLVEF